MGIIEDSTRSASVVATEDVELMVIPREAFSEMFFKLSDNNVEFN